MSRLDVCLVAVALLAVPGSTARAQGVVAGGWGPGFIGQPYGGAGYGYGAYGYGYGSYPNRYRSR